MKIAFVYTVRRESDCLPENLQKAIDDFESGVKQEPGEYLFSATDGDVKVEMQVSKNGRVWETIYGDPR